MKLRKLKKSFIPICLLILFIAFPITMGTKGQNPTPVFDLTFLVPNTNPARIIWAELIGDEIAQIGINVKHYNFTGWDGIAPRTWAYPFIDYSHIPTYDEGGFDVLFVGYTMGFNLDFLDVYETSTIPPNGDNFYQFSNATYDTIMDLFMQETDIDQRTAYGHQLQKIIYEELPVIGLLYPGDLFGFKEGLVGINATLLSERQQRSENWDDPDDHIIIYAIPASLYEQNCFRVESGFDRLWMQNVYGSLFKRNQTDFFMAPEIARNYSISMDKLNITVDIDPNAKFSNGDPVLAEDVKYTYELHMTPEVGSPDYGYITNWLQTSDSIEIVDIDTVKFCLSSIDNYPLNMLNFGIIDKSVVEPLIASYGYDIFWQTPGTGDVGWGLVTSCGPFMVDSYSSSDVGLLPNPYWHGKTVSLTRFNLTTEYDSSNALANLVAGNIDILDYKYMTVLADYEGLSGVDAFANRRLYQQEMSINMKHPIIGTGELTPAGTALAAKYIRHAISHAIPRQRIVDEILYGLGFPGILPIPDCSPGFDKTLTPYSYDISYAKTLIELAGYILVVVPEYIHTSLLLFFLIGVVSIYSLKRFKKK